MNAVNVVELELDHEVVTTAYQQVEDILGYGYVEGQRVSEQSGIGLFSLCPGWNGDLRWVSAGNDRGFAFFDHYFQRLGVAEKTQDLLGDCGQLIMYSGFFVVRSHTVNPYYHVDFSAAVGLNALTLMTPIKPTGDAGNLLFHDVNGDEQVYRYSTGKAVCFGGEFYHSTEPFESDQPYVFLCFSYGVTDLKLWDAIAETAAEQGKMYRHPAHGIVAVAD